MQTYPAYKELLVIFNNVSAKNHLTLSSKRLVKANLLVLLWSYHFPIGILGQVWCLIVWIPDLCPFSYFEIRYRFELNLILTSWLHFSAHFCDVLFEFQGESFLYFIWIIYQQTVHMKYRLIFDF